EVFGLVAQQLTFAGVDNPDCFWAEVDTPTEALDANQRIPPSLVDLAGRKIEPAPPIERRRAPAIDVQPVLYLDHLLNGHFAPLVEDIPDAGRQVRSVLRRNKQEFINCVDALGIGSLSAIQLHCELQRMIESMDAALGDTYSRDIIYSTGG